MRRVIWLTGLPGSGKTTLGRALVERFEAVGVRAYLVDGDALREGLNADLGFTREARSEACRRIAEVARIVGEAEVLPIVAAVSPYRDDRHRARQRFDPGYFIEVHVHAPLALCEQRDPKGLYRRARAGEIVGFTGVDDPYEEPASPELLVDTQAMSLELATQHVFSEVVRVFTDRAMGRTRR